jgi:hypothetical protein
MLKFLLKQNSGNPSEANRLQFCLPCKKQNSGNPSEANRPEFCLPCKKQNSGNQPEFQTVCRQADHQPKNEQLIRLLFAVYVTLSEVEVLS